VGGVGRAATTVRRGATPQGGETRWWDTPNHASPWKQRYDAMKVWRPLEAGRREAEIALALPLRSALNARPSASQGFALG
jgi:hypothetical protein